MNNVGQGPTLLLAVVVALIALAGVVLFRYRPLKLIALVVGIAVELYLLGYLPQITALRGIGI